MQNDSAQNMKRAIVTAWHKYTPFGGEYYEPLLDFYIKQMEKWSNEYDHVYFMDSNWGVNPEKLVNLKADIIKVDQHLRYYDAYKAILPQIKESLVLFTDNDMVVYKPNIISSTFELLKDKYDVVSIYDTIGKTYPQLGNKSKFCPYWFATGTPMLKDFTKCEWGPNMPEHETLGKLTELMLEEEVIPYELEEDKSNCLFDGAQDGKKSKDLGYYHIRAGSTPAYLLATEKYGDMQTYKDYLEKQPKDEYLRQCAWYQYMGGNADQIIIDAGIELSKWHSYYERFKAYHGL